jgi:hypothetical protein
MTSLILELVVMLVFILIASELFTNALEHLGARLKISEGVTERFNIRAQGLRMLLINGLLYVAYLAWTLAWR